MANPFKDFMNLPGHRGSNLDSVQTVDESAGVLAQNPSTKGSLFGGFDRALKGNQIIKALFNFWRSTEV